MVDLSAFEVTGTNDPAKQVSVTLWNALLAALEGGSSYEAGPIGTVPTAASLTWVNQDSATIADGTGALILTSQTNSELHGLYKTAPATPFSVYARHHHTYISTAAVTNAQQINAMIILRDSSDGEIVTFGYQDTKVSGDEQELREVGFKRWTNAGAFVGDGDVNWLKPGENFPWLRVANDGTTLTGFISADGKNWLPIGTEALASHIDTADEYGFGTYTATNATEHIAVISYLGTTAPV